MICSCIVYLAATVQTVGRVRPCQQDLVIRQLSELALLVEVIKIADGGAVVVTDAGRIVGVAALNKSVDIEGQRIEEDIAACDAPAGRRRLRNLAAGINAAHDLAADID